MRDDWEGGHNCSFLPPQRSGPWNLGSKMKNEKRNDITASNILSVRGYTW